MALARQLHRVDAVGRNSRRTAWPIITQRMMGHDDVVVAGHLEHHDDRGQRRAGGAAEHGRHADDGEIRVVQMQARQQRIEQAPKAPPSVAPRTSEAENTPPTPPEPSVIDVAISLATSSKRRNPTVRRWSRRMSWIVE